MHGNNLIDFHRLSLRIFGVTTETRCQSAIARTCRVLILAMLSGLLFGRGLTAQAQTLTTIHDFTGGADGAQPFSTLVKDNQGNLYGTTWWGGSKARTAR